MSPVLITFGTGSVVAGKPFALSTAATPRRASGTADAGPFTPLVLDLVEATAAQTVDLVRLQTAS